MRGDTWVMGRSLEELYASVVEERPASALSWLRVDAADTSTGDVTGDVAEM